MDVESHFDDRREKVDRIDEGARNMYQGRRALRPARLPLKVLPMNGHYRPLKGPGRRQKTSKSAASIRTRAMGYGPLSKKNHQSVSPSVGDLVVGESVWSRLGSTVQCACCDAVRSVVPGFLASLIHAQSGRVWSRTLPAGWLLSNRWAGRLPSPRLETAVL